MHFSFYDTITETIKQDERVIDRSYGVLEGKVWKPDWELFLREEIKRYQVKDLESLPGVEPESSILIRVAAVIQFLCNLQSEQTEGLLHFLNEFFIDNFFI